MKKITVLFFTIFLFQFSFAQCDFDPTVEGELILCPNSSTVLSTQIYDSYQWYKREYGQSTSYPIPGDTMQTITITNPGDVPYYFSVEATLDGCTELSPEVLVDGLVFLPVTVISTGDFEIGQNGESIVCIGDTMYFTLGLPYNTNITWYRNGQPISEETSTVLAVTTPGLYTVTAAPGECPDYLQSLGLTLTVEFIECTSATEDNLLNSTQILIYPNPATDHLNIQGQYVEILDVSIYNHIGQLVKKEIVSGFTKTINIFGLQSGIYFVDVNCTSGVYRAKIIVN